MKNITRRSALWGMALAASSAALAREKATAFGLIGDRYHNSDYARVGLTRTISKEAGVSVDFTDDTSLLTEETLDGYKLLIILRDGMAWPNGYGGSETSNAAWNGDKPELVADPPLPEPTRAEPEFWMKPEQGKAVRDFVENGGSALFLHNVTHVGLTDPNFRHVMGGGYAGHPPIRPYKARITNRDHPITKGVNDFMVTDEQHYMEYDKDRKNIFMETESMGGLDYRGQGATAPGGWAYDYGKGRVCYLSPGHLLTVLWNPEVVKLHKNAVRWLLRQS